jgi:hypothetical protein
MLLDLNLNKNMWGDTNRSPTSALEEKTTAEIWFIKNQMCQILKFLVQ